MKKSLIALILCAVSSVSCSKQPAAAPVVPAASAPAAPASAPSKEPEQKRVCIKVWDAKANKEVEKCRTLKIHQKYEGTKVPPSK